MLKVANKYLLAFPKDKSVKVSQLLSRSGCFEVLANPQEASFQREKVKKNLQGVEYRLASLDFAISYLAPLAPKESFLRKIRQPKIILDRVQRGKFNFEKKETIFKTVKRLEKIEKKFDSLTREEKDSHARFLQLEKFGDLNFSPQETEFTFSILTVLTERSFDVLQGEARKNGWHFRELSRIGGSICLIVFIPREDREKLGQGLKELKAEIIQYNYAFSPAVERVIIQQRSKEAAMRQANLEKEKALIARHFVDFKIYRDILAIQQSRLRAEERVLGEGIMEYLVFWGYEQDKIKLVQRLSELGDDIVLVEAQPEPNEEPPVKLENNRILAPFQYITEIYGLPKKGEIDPTPYLAFFFILFFGICLTDAGYGIVLIVITILPLLFLKKLFTDTKLLRLLFYGGISTLVMGILFGSYFGASTATVAKFPILLKLKQIDPIEDTVLFMAIAFLLGCLQVFFAQLVKIISGFKSANREIIINGLAWASFYIAVAFFGISHFFVPVLEIVSLPFLILASLSLLWAESRGVKIFLRPLLGIVKVLQGLIGTVSDVLSYSRLVALGLATSVIAMIVNQIAFLLGGMVPWIGWLLTALILLGGHTFNLCINALGAFIHSGRLQFVEFFPKFLEGGGRRFKPLKSELKYIKLAG